MNVESLVEDEVNNFLNTLGEEVARYNPDSPHMKESYKIKPVSFSVGDLTIMLVSQDVGSYLCPEGEKIRVSLSVPRQKVSNPDADNTMPYVTELDVESARLSTVLDTFDDLFPEDPKFMHSDNTPSSYVFSERFTVTTEDMNLDGDYTVTEIVTLEVNREIAIVETGSNPLDAVSGDMAFAISKEDTEDVNEIRKQDTFQFEGKDVSFEQRIAGPALVDVETDEVLFYVTDKWGDWGELLKDREELSHDDEWSSGLSNL